MSNTLTQSGSAAITGAGGAGDATTRFPESLLARWDAGYAGDRSAQSNSRVLTARERDVLARISQGFSNKRIARTLEILAYHKENLLIEHRVNEIVAFAIEHMWDTVRAHKEIIRNVTEVILRDGIESGSSGRSPATAEVMMRSMVAFCHPMLVSQCLEEGHDLEAEARASVRFLPRAITPR